MAYRAPQAARQALVRVAQVQGGYVTAAQAREAGYGPQHLTYHVRAGNLERVGHGLYRLPELSMDENDDLVRLALWSRDRRGRPQAVVSHQSALALRDLSDILPRQIHLTVPPTFRKPAPRGCVLHRAVLVDGECDAWTVFSVTTPLRTLCDVATSRGVSMEQLELAVEQVLQRGLVRLAVLRDAAAAPGRERLASAVAQATRP
jgi:predicted transcriptional regulator of viral defense system